VVRTHAPSGAGARGLINRGTDQFLRSENRGLSPVPAFKAVLFALLAANTAYFAIAGTLSKATDAAAWLLLLALFEAETRFGARLERAAPRRILRTVRLAAGAAVVAATVGYVFENNALDALNSVLWIAIVVLLELEVRYRDAVQRVRLALSSVAACLYGGLALVVLMWVVRRQWFDAYDALLWLVAFAAIEVDLVSRKHSVNALTSR
jgi:hypothetical protein